MIEHVPGDIEERMRVAVLRKGEEMSQVRVDTEPHGVKSLVSIDDFRYYLISEVMFILPNVDPKVSLMQNDKCYSQNT